MEGTARTGTSPGNRGAVKRGGTLGRAQRVLHTLRMASSPRQPKSSRKCMVGKPVSGINVDLSATSS